MQCTRSFLVKRARSAVPVIAGGAHVTRKQQNRMHAASATELFSSLWQLQDTQASQQGIHVLGFAKLFPNIHSVPQMLQPCQLCDMLCKQLQHRAMYTRSQHATRRVLTVTNAASAGCLRNPSCLPLSCSLSHSAELAVCAHTCAHMGKSQQFQHCVICCSTEVDSLDCADILDLRKTKQMPRSPVQCSHLKAEIPSPKLTPIL